MKKFMQKITVSYLYFITGILFAIISVMYFNTDNKSSGSAFLCLALTFISLGFSLKKKKDN